MNGTGISGQKQTGNSWSYEPEEPEPYFVDSILVKLEPELHLENLVPVIRTGIVEPELRFELEAQP